MQDVANTNQLENNLNNILVKEFDVNLYDYVHLEAKYYEFKEAFCSMKIMKCKSKSKKIELIDQLLETFKLKNYISLFII